MPAQIEINGHRLALHEGDSILDAARRAGIEIPTLCHRSGLPAEGGCRMCVVEVAGSDKLQAACHTPASDGMRIQTDTPRLETLRRELLQLTLMPHPAGAFQADAEGSEFEKMLDRYQVDAADCSHATEHGEKDESHPYLRFDADRCITCRRCLHACEQVQGQFVYGVAGRGAGSHLIFGPRTAFAESECVACGACVDACPTHSITDRDRTGSTQATQVTQSTCGYCGVGCQLEIEAHDDRVLRIRGVADAEVNRGHLCVKGRYAHAYHHSADRLQRPLLRDGSQWREVDWPDAIDWLAGRLAEIAEKHGPESLGAFTSSRSTNEAAYLLQKLFRTAVGTNNVDCCARVCHSSTALALQTVTGTGAASASYVDIERAHSIVIAGANPTEAHPVVGARLKQAVLRGARLIVIDPRRIELAEYADVHLAPKPGTNVPLFNALAKLLIEAGGGDQPYIEENLESYPELLEFLKKLSLEQAAEITGVPVESMQRAAAQLGELGPTLFVHGLGLSELYQGTASVMTLCNLGMLTGSIGRPGAGMLPLRGQNNVQGNADMGSMPNQATGYQRVDDPDVAAHFERLWGHPLPQSAGKTTTEMIEAAARGEMRALWIQGEDAVQSDPNETQVIQALEQLELLVVQDLFFSETAHYAHLVLPAAGALEQEGTFTNGERRIQMVRPAVAPPTGARPDWEVIRDVGIAMGEPWAYPDAAAVMDEVSQAAPRLFGGVSFDRLGKQGLQWPCPAPDHPGTSTVHADGLLRGRGQLVSIEFVASPEHQVDGFPFLLITGRVLDHYNVGTMTRRTPSRDLVPEDRLEIHPDDAQREKISDAGWVEIESRWGKTRARARVTSRVASGMLFLSFHYPETHANRLTGPQHDPQSKCPEYKVTAVRVQPGSPAHADR